MLLTISGPSGSGKSSLAAGLSKKLGVPTLDVGAQFRKMAAEHKMSVNDFGKYAEKHPEIDREFDARLMKLAAKAVKKGHLIMQSRLAGLMTHRDGVPALRVWVTATAKTRSERISQREKRSVSQIYRETTARDADNLTRYKKTYGLDLRDLSVYDIVVKTDGLTLKQSIANLYSKVKPLWPTRTKPKRRRPPSR